MEGPAARMCSETYRLPAITSPADREEQPEMLGSPPMSTRTPPDAPDQDEEEYDLTPEEEEELLARYEQSIIDEREGKLIPWEAVFPPKRLTG